MSDNEQIATMSDQEDEEEEEGENFAENALLRYVWRSMAMRHSLTNDNHAGLINSLKRSGTLKTERIIEAYMKTPRAEFLLENMADDAYSDQPLRFSTMGFNTSAPHMYSMCLEALQPQEGHSFLDIGSGCGQLTLIASLLTGPTGFALGLDIRQDIIDLSVSNVASWKGKNPDEEFNVSFELRNCFLVDAEERKWDCIHVGACCPDYRLQYLIDILKPNGRLVTPYGDQLLLVKKSKDGKDFVKKTLADVRYGDLVVPSEAEVREAILIAESRKRQHIDVPESSGFDENAANLFNSEKYSDYALVVEGRSIPVHKLILRSRCEHFENMFESGMRESSAEHLIIEDFSYDQVLAALQVIYTGSCEISPANAVELLEIANFYKLEWMKCRCELILHENIEIETAAQIFEIADRFDAKQLRAASLEFLLKNHQAIMMTPEFQALDKHLIIEVMKEACSRATLDA